LANAQNCSIIYRDFNILKSWIDVRRKEVLECLSLMIQVLRLSGLRDPFASSAGSFVH